MNVGYARVSTAGQNLENQIEQLQSVGCKKIFSEKRCSVWEKSYFLVKPVPKVRGCRRDYSKFCALFLVDRSLCRGN